MKGITLKLSGLFYYWRFRNLTKSWEFESQLANSFELNYWQTKCWRSENCQAFCWKLVNWQAYCWELDSLRVSCWKSGGWQAGYWVKIS